MEALPVQIIFQACQNTRRVLYLGRSGTSYIAWNSSYNADFRGLYTALIYVKPTKQDKLCRRHVPVQLRYPLAEPSKDRTLRWEIYTDNKRDDDVRKSHRLF